MCVKQGINIVFVPYTYVIMQRKRFFIFDQIIYKATHTHAYD